MILCLLAFAWAGALVDRVAAVVDDEIVTLSEVYELGGDYINTAAANDEGQRLKAELEVLDQLIDRELVEQVVRRLDLDVEETELDRSIDDIASRNGLDRDTLRREVEASGMPWDTYRSELREELREMKFAQSVLRPRVTISEDEIRDAWLRATADAPRSARVQAILLLYPTGADEAARNEVHARAQSLREQAKAGADFSELARANDMGPYGAQGGDMGTIKPGQLLPAVDRVVFATAPGEVAEPVVLPTGVILLRVVALEAGGAEYESMKEQLSYAIFQTRIEDERERWAVQARREASVRVLLTPPAAASP